MYSTKKSDYDQIVTEKNVELMEAFRVAKSDGGGFHAGDIVVLQSNDGGCCPLFKMVKPRSTGKSVSRSTNRYFYLKDLRGKLRAPVVAPIVKASAVKKPAPWEGLVFDQIVTPSNLAEFDYFMSVEEGQAHFCPKGSILRKSYVNKDYSLFKWVGGVEPADFAYSETKSSHWQLSKLRGGRVVAKVEPVKEEEVRPAESETFWLLWCPTTHRPPTVRHRTLAEAQRVAELMAERNPGQKFYITEVKGVSETTKPVVTRMFS